MSQTNTISKAALKAREYRRLNADKVKAYELARQEKRN